MLLALLSLLAISSCAEASHSTFPVKVVLKSAATQLKYVEIPILSAKVAKA
jgi:hypothetical protein